jgi:hypothetical protein
MPPDLTQGFAIFANWQTVVLCLGIYLITYFLRTIIENTPGTKTFSQGWVWQTILLPLGPIATGVLIALFSKKFPWPMPIADAGLAREFYGGICGLGSGWMYARIRDWFGIAADAGNPMAQKVAAKFLSRPVSGSPAPMALGPSVRPPPNPMPSIDETKTTPPPKV